MRVHPLGIVMPPDDLSTANAETSKLPAVADDKVTVSVVTVVVATLLTLWTFAHATPHPYANTHHPTALGAIV